MLSCRLQCALALLSIALALGTVSAAPSDPRLRQFLQKSLAAAAGKQVRAPRVPSGSPLPQTPRFPLAEPPLPATAPGIPAADPSSSSPVFPDAPVSDARSLAADPSSPTDPLAPRRG
ncbi:hypothetical protein Nmel_011761 [Mimus melanotis]